MTKSHHITRRTVLRGLGWDIDSPLSSNRGELLPVGSYGHTGFTGTCLWIDPFSKTFWIFLSNRVHPDGKGNVLPLEAQLANLAAEAVPGFNFAYVPGSLPPQAASAVTSSERLRAEKANPQADVWWSNEPFHTINLANEGVLSEYDSPAAKDLPQRFKDPNHRWASSGLRARVLAVRKGTAVRGLADLLTAPPGKAAMARPSGLHSKSSTSPGTGTSPCPRLRIGTRAAIT